MVLRSRVDAGTAEIIQNQEVLKSRLRREGCLLGAQVLGRSLKKVVERVKSGGWQEMVNRLEADE
jgi:hypothetical protein